MKRYPKLLVCAAFSASLVGWLACESPPPTCSPSETGYDICSENRVWECPIATEEQRASGEMIETTLKADCAAAGQVCSEDILEGPPECTDP